MKRLIISIATCAILAISAAAGTPVRKTVSEFLAMSSSDTTLCELKGVVERVRNYNHGNLYLNDGTGSVLIYGVINGNLTFPQTDVRQGDTLTVSGRRFVYDGRVIEMKNARYVSHAEGPNHENVGKVDNLDRNPKFKGGNLSDFSKWVSSRLVYPAEAIAACAEGKVLVRFVVGRDGKIYEPSIIESPHPALGAEAVRVISKSPKWTAGMVDNKPVRVSYTMPVIFLLPR